MTLLRAAGFSLSFGSRVLFDDLTMVVEEGERVGLVGVNGSGKSTLLKLLSGEMVPDAGERQLRRGTRIAYLPQEPVFPAAATVAGELSVAQAPLRVALAEHRALGDRLANLSGPSLDRAVAELTTLSERIEHLGGWDTEHLARTLLDRLGVKEWDRPISELSGGLQKRVAIARALLARPDLLLLDEPTNHLDADTVEWLEEALDDLESALVLVTHDRYFLDDLVDRIIEIQPGSGVVSYPGNYEAYLEQKLVGQAQGEAAGHKRDRWIAQEVAWLRRGPEARRTKSKARIERARKLMAERGFVRPRVPELQSVATPRLGHTVLEARQAAFCYGSREVLRNVDVIVQGGERIGIVGPNGAGKTTLVRLLLGELTPSRGSVVRGKNTRFAHYDQARAKLDPEQTVYEAAWGEDFVNLGGRQVALRDYLDDLLLPVPMQRMQVKALSGGERNRLLLARIFLMGANLLVLDEPTNDLDLVTLNVLERLLLGFGGSVLLVTHDRYFLDKVATRILAVEGDGSVVAYPGNFSLYRRLKAQGALSARTGSPAKPLNFESTAPTAGTKPSKLSYRDQRELEGMEAAIQAAEKNREASEAALVDPGVYSDAAASTRARDELALAVAEVDRLYARWEELLSRVDSR
ncbi:MAG: ABC-F family ATP-binding cassette domain-containing protein [Myxococcaceae bacterium]